MHTHTYTQVRNSGIAGRKSSRLATPPPSPKSTDRLDEQARVVCVCVCVSSWSCVQNNEAVTVAQTTLVKYSL